MAAILSKTIWNPNKNVWILNDPVFQMVGTIAKALAPTLWKLDHMKSNLQKFWNLYVSNVQIPTEFTLWISDLEVKLMAKF